MLRQSVLLLQRSCTQQHHQRCCAGLLACRRYEQERQAQHDEPAGGASTSGLQDKPRDRGVKFAVVEASSGDGSSWPSTSHLLGDEHGGSTPVAVVSKTGFFSFTRPKVCRPLATNYSSTGLPAALHRASSKEACLSASPASLQRLWGPAC